ncbi:MAG: calcium-binding protein [Gemmataceae bacterium]
MTTTRKPTCLNCETLEERSLMAAGVTSSLDAYGVYRVVGTNGPDAITLYHRDGLVWHGGAQWAYWADQVKLIVVHTGAGNDTVFLNSETIPGNQALGASAWVFTGAGDDTVVGGAKYNLIDGGLGNDRIWGGGNSDFIAGGDGNDVLCGLGGNDFLIGNAGLDTLYGGAGNDRLDGGAGYDWLYAHEGNDILCDDWALRNGGTGINLGLNRCLTFAELSPVARTFALTSAANLNLNWIALAMDQAVATYAGPWLGAGIVTNYDQNYLGRMVYEFYSGSFSTVDGIIMGYMKKGFRI